MIGSRVGSALGCAAVLLVLGIGFSVTRADGPVENGVWGRAVPAPSAGVPVTPVPGLPSFVFLGPADFNGSSSQDQIERPNATLIAPGRTMAGIDVVAPVHLPTGVFITQVTIFYRDTDPATRPSAGLWSSQFGALTLIATLDPALPPVTFADGRDTRSVSVDTMVVAPRDTSYVVLVTLNRDLQDSRLGQELYGVRVDYAYQRMLPVVQH